MGSNHLTSVLLLMGLCSSPSVGSGCIQEPPPGPSRPEATHLRDLAMIDGELAKRRREWAAHKASGNAQKDVKQLLTRLCGLDQYLRKSFNFPHEHGYGGTPGAQAFTEGLVRRMSALDADNDAPFQRKVLEMLEPLLASGETNPSNFALLHDRVTVNEGRLQRYGTQGFCVGPGKWAPRPIEDPEHVDARRKAMNLPPMADYMARFEGLCHQDETAKALEFRPLPRAEAPAHQGTQPH